MLECESTDFAVYEILLNKAGYRMFNIIYNIITMYINVSKNVTL